MKNPIATTVLTLASALAAPYAHSQIAGAPREYRQLWAPNLGWRMSARGRDFQLEPLGS